MAEAESVRANRLRLLLDVRDAVGLLGDLSLYHDMNGLWALQRHGIHATIVVCDNNGGGCSAIDGATNQTYAVASADVGHALRVQETASNAGGSSEPATSDPTAVVVQSPPSTVSEPSIQGTAAEGQMLTPLHPPPWQNGVDSYA